MKTEIILKHLGYVLLINALFLFIAFLISFFLKEESVEALLFSSLICLIFGMFPQIYVGKTDRISFSEGLSIVVYGWIVTCIAGMLPYLMWGGEFSLANAWFESVSGFTTTGSTILNDIESLPKGILFWRSSTHWIGGIGIILFVLLLLPRSSKSRINIYNAEISGLSKLNFQFKARKTIQVLAIVYIFLTFIETLLLWIFGMDLFDAINHSFATIATGGFSTKNMSIASFNSIAIEIIIIIFMLISGIHFGLIYGTFARKKDNIFSSNMVKAFLLVMLIGTIFVSVKLYLSGMYDYPNSLRYAAFQVVSLGTTTGFANIDSAAWPIFTRLILIYFTIQCAMAGSTSGGLKFDRVYIFFKILKKQLRLIRHPHGVFAIKVSGKGVDHELERQTLVFLALYILTFFTTTIILTAMNIDGMTAFSASIATIGNVGPGFGDVSSLGNFGSLPDAAKYVLSINMLMGRLEIFNILTLFLAR